MAARSLVFAMGVGRCGTRSLASAFGSLPDVFSVHEPSPSLIELAEVSFRGHVVSLARLHELRRELDHFPYYLESSIWNCWLVPSILELWPHAQFIWLTRNVFEWAYSAYRRGWYLSLAEETRETMVRLRPQPIWPGGISRWFKLGFLWQFYNDRIGGSLYKHRAPWIMIDVKSLNDIKVLEALRLWCEFPGTIKETVHENKGDLYVTTRELHAEYRDASGENLDIPLHVTALTEVGVKKVAERAALCQKFAGLPEDAVKDLTAGMRWASQPIGTNY